MVAHMSHSEYLPQKRILLLPFLLFVILACSGLAGANAGLLQAFWIAHFFVSVTYTAIYLILVVCDLCHLLDVYAFRIKAPAKEGPTTLDFVGNKSDWSWWWCILLGWRIHTYIDLGSIQKAILFLAHK